MLYVLMRILARSKVKKGPSELTPNPQGKRFEINNWELSELVVEKLAPIVGVHPFPVNELLLMAGSVARFRPDLIFDWGTHIGKAARIFSEVSKEFGLNTVIHSTDLPDESEHAEHPHDERGKFVIGHKNVKLHQGDGLDTSLKLMKKSKKNTSGRGVIFFVDGDHSYDSVKRELSAIIAEAPEAAILLHDTFYQSADSQYNIGPHQAINDNLKKNRNYSRIDTSTGLPGMTLLYPA